MTLLSASYLFAILPVILSVAVYMAATFGHLNFKLINIKTIKIISAILGGVFGWMYFINMYTLNAQYGFYVMDIYHLFFAVLVLFTALWGGVRGTIRFGILQIIGFPIFLYSAYLLLA